MDWAAVDWAAIDLAVSALLGPPGGARTGRTGTGPRVRCAGPRPNCAWAGLQGCTVGGWGWDGTSGGVRGAAQRWCLQCGCPDGGLARCGGAGPPTLVCGVFVLLPGCVLQFVGVLRSAWAVWWARPQCVCGPRYAASAALPQAFMGRFPCVQPWACWGGKRFLVKRQLCLQLCRLLLLLSSGV